MNATDRVRVRDDAAGPLVGALTGWFGGHLPDEFCAGEAPERWWDALEQVDPPVVLEGQMGLLDALGSV